MEIKSGWWLTGSGGKNYVVYQPEKVGKYYKEFTAKNTQEAQKIALKIIEEFEKS